MFLFRSTTTSNTVITIIRRSITARSTIVISIEVPKSPLLAVGTAEGSGSELMFGVGSGVGSGVISGVGVGVGVGVGAGVA